MLDPDPYTINTDLYSVTSVDEGFVFLEYEGKRKCFKKRQENNFKKTEMKISRRHLRRRKVVSAPACCKVCPKFESPHCTPQHWATALRINTDRSTSNEEGIKKPQISLKI
jgi:hypothetical protein